MASARAQSQNTCVADSALRVLEFSVKSPPWPMPWVGDWELRFERDTRGKFSRLVVSISGWNVRGGTLWAELAPGNVIVYRRCDVVKA